MSSAPTNPEAITHDYTTCKDQSPLCKTPGKIPHISEHRNNFIHSPFSRPVVWIVSHGSQKQSVFGSGSLTWKKNLTMNTCSPPMAIIRAIWIKLKLIILFSVLRTVLKFRFSRVLKYFWCRVIVDSWPDTLNRDSSSADVCSGDVPCFAGRLTRASFSTCRAETMC